MITPDILALDFDGVICDGRQEYFQSGWQTYCRIWKPSDTTPPNGLSDRYIRLAPVIETDLDVTMLVRALMLDISDDSILHHWHTLVAQLIEEENLTETDINIEFAQVRDEWIANHVEAWLSHQPLYPGVQKWLAQLLNSPLKVVIITNRIQRFAVQILHREGLNIPEAQVFGKQGQRPKYEVLRSLIAPEQPLIWFVEDHVKALRLVEEQSDLASVNLFLADWGFNTPTVRASVTNSRIRLLSFTQFTQDFAAWV